MNNITADITNKILDNVFKTFIETAPVLCLAADTNFIIFYVNRYYEEVHNISIEEARGKHIKDIIGEEGFNNNIKYYKETLKGNIVNRMSSFTKLDGSIHHYKATYSPIYNDGEIVGICGVVLDITAEIQNEKYTKELQLLNKELISRKDKLILLASTDDLTKLKNRKSYNENIEKQLSLYKRYRRPFSMIMFDIDDFKKINDSYGHNVGDNVLIEIS